MKIKEILKQNVLYPIEEAGFKAYFVGGCVRDAIIGIEPHDYDICTDATPEDLHKIFRKFSNVSDNSEPFGVTMPLIEMCNGNLEEVEIATLRKDITKGRHPKIEFTNSVAEDASRRDFTINAIFEDVDGNIIDPVGGVEDINNKTLRFVGDMNERLDEDPLRLFRAIRFMSKTGFTPSFSVMDLDFAACRLLDANRFEEVSKERMLKEVEGIFGGKHFDFVFEEFFWASQIDTLIGMRPIIDSLMTCNQSFKWHAEGAWIERKDGTGISVSKPEDLKDFAKLVSHGNAWDHTYFVMERMFNLLNEAGIEDTHKRFLMMMAAFCHDIGKPIAAKKGEVKHNTLEFNGVTIVEDIPRVVTHDIDGEIPAFEFCKQLGMTNKDCDFVSQMTLKHMRAHRISEMKSKARIWKFVQWKHFDELCLLAQADEEACVKTFNDEWEGIMAAVRKPDIWKLHETPLPTPVINGKVLIEKGFKPGPKFKKAIDHAFEMQIDKNCTDADTLIKKFIKDML